MDHLERQGRADRSAGSEDRYAHLILSALRRDPLPDSGGLDPERLLWRICEHGLAGLMEDASGGAGRDPGGVLGAIAPQVKAVARAQEALVALQLRAAAELAGELRKRGIPAVFVKGVALALSAYPRPGLRPFGDLDLLIPPAQLPSARAALAARGFAPDAGATPSTMESVFVRAGAGELPVMVDLHWAFVETDGPQAAVRVPLGGILERRREVGGIPIPSGEDNLLLAAANLVRSRLDRMVLIVDFCRLAATRPDWDLLVARASEGGLRTALWLGLSRAAELFGAEVPGAVLDRTAPAAWRRRFIEGLLAGPGLWARRKIRHRFLAYSLPFLCLDSWGDVTMTLGAGRGRALAKLGFAGPPRD